MTRAHTAMAARSWDRPERLMMLVCFGVETRQRAFCDGDGRCCLLSETAEHVKMKPRKSTLGGRIGHEGMSSYVSACTSGLQAY